MPDHPFYITTAIDYTNAPPHIGHAYEKILADCLARYQRLCGNDVLFLTGVDQHGQKVQQAAEKLGISPAQFANDITEKFLALWKTLGISYDRWAATTSPVHREIVQKILTKLKDADLLYKARHEGFYSIRQEQFLTDKDRDAEGNFGPEWGEVQFLEEENWYFRLGDQISWLEEFLASHPGVVFPDFRQLELVNAVGKGGGDLCISRPKTRLTWGIELPFDPDFVTYVWFDALINYVSFSGYLAEEESERERFAHFWPADAHVIGKDILVPAHGVYWLCMLHAMGFPDESMPALLVHGWWNLGGAKVSKSLGNVVDPAALVEKYGVDALRYYLLRDISTGRDAEFSEDRLTVIYNSELANGLGNLLNRSLNMTHRYRSGFLQPLPATPSPGTQAVLAEVADAMENYHRKMRVFDVQGGIQEVVNIINAANGFAEKTAPWKLAKQPDEAAFLDEVLTVLALSTRAAASLLTPVIPGAVEKIFQQLGFAAESTNADLLRLRTPHQVGPPEPVFPRIEADAPANQ